MAPFEALYAKSLTPAENGFTHTLAVDTKGGTRILMCRAEWDNESPP